MIAELLNVALPTGLIVVGVWFGLAEGWPYWKSRDTENRQREHDREIAQVGASNAMSGALLAVADAVRGCPVRPVSSTNVGET